MRGGYRVPATPFGDNPIAHMSTYKIAEIVTDLAFAETQREIVVNGDTAVTIDNGAANYVYIAQTGTSTIGVYANDVRPAYYWVDDLQFVGVSDGTPAAIVTISPDVWLTDFFPNTPTVRGRLAQSTILMAGEPRTPLVAPVFDQRFIVQTNALTGNSFWVVGVFTDARGGIQSYAIDANNMATAKQWAQAMGGAAKITITVPSAPAQDIEISCIRVYIIPDDFATTTNGERIVNTSTNTGYLITSANGVKIDVYPFATIGGVGLKRVHNVTFPPALPTFTSLSSRAWICTPARFVELNEMRGISWNNSKPLAASFFISASSSGDDGIKIYMQVGTEFIDVSDDFLADFATNAQSVQQAQQKQLVALQAITGVIGAAGGVAGGVASGNYFGAVQSIAGGVQSIAGLGQARRTPAQMRGNGGVAAFYGFANTLVLLIGMGTPVNNAEIADVENEFGWQYDNAPLKTYNANIPTDNYYRFSDVVVENVTGGTAAAEEIATAFATGVRLVSL